MTKETTIKEMGPADQSCNVQLRRKWARSQPETGSLYHDAATTSSLPEYCIEVYVAEKELVLDLQHIGPSMAPHSIIPLRVICLRDYQRVEEITILVAVILASNIIPPPPHPSDMTRAEITQNNPHVKLGILRNAFLLAD